MEEYDSKTSWDAEWIPQLRWVCFLKYSHWCRICTQNKQYLNHQVPYPLSLWNRVLLGKTGSSQSQEAYLWLLHARIIGLRYVVRGTQVTEYGSFDPIICKFFFGGRAVIISSQFFCFIAHVLALGIHLIEVRYLMNLELANLVNLGTSLSEDTLSLSYKCWDFKWTFTNTQLLCNAECLSPRPHTPGTSLYPFSHLSIPGPYLFFNSLTVRPWLVITWCLNPLASAS